MLILILFAFIAGFVTILSPCILPVLPIVLSSSAASGKRRPFGILAGFVTSFTFFTLALTAIVKSTGLSADALRGLAIVIILIFGITMFVPKIQLYMEELVGKLSKIKPKTDQNTGFAGGFFVGMSLGLVWTPCAGPILASVITLAATSSVTIGSVLITLAYSVGTAIPMTLIIFGGRALLQKVPFLLKNAAKVQKFFGVIIILVAIGMYYNLDRKFQAYVLEQFPQYGSGLTQIEELDIVKNQLDELSMLPTEEEIASMNDPEVCPAGGVPAPGFEEGGEWLGTEPLALEELKGKVVLVDFWTYTCINCIRTLPYLNAWHEKYAEDGLVIVGVHTPEFEFEKSKENVLEAMADFGIEYPVVQDNDYKIWRSYNNRYWPAKYFVDKNGCIRDSHFGEGAYEESEEFIQELLKEAGHEVDGEVVDVEEYKGEARTPELYLGYGRIKYFDSPEELSEDEVATYTIPEDLDVDYFAYGGNWEIGEERAMAVEDGVLELNFRGKEVFLVMRSEDEAKVKVSLDQLDIDADDEVMDGNGFFGEDVDEDGYVTVMKDRLYKLVKGADLNGGVLRLEFEEGVEVFAFTFG